MDDQLRGVSLVGHIICTGEEKNIFLEWLDSLSEPKSPRRRGFEIKLNTLKTQELSRTCDRHVAETTN
jgi:hypothetical protein